MKMVDDTTESWSGLFSIHWMRIMERGGRSRAKKYSKILVYHMREKKCIGIFITVFQTHT